MTNRSEPAPTEGESEAVRNQLKYSLESRSNFEAYNALLDAAKVEDNRLEIFYN